MYTTNAEKLFAEFLKHDELKSIPDINNLTYRTAMESNSPLLRALGALIYHKEHGQSFSEKEILERVIVAIKATKE